MDDRSGIFLSYRREDSAGFAGRLYDDLEERIPGARVFMDVDTIQPGEDFVQAIERAMGGSSVVLVLIGPRWLDATDSSGARRIDNPLDYVRLEIESGLRAGKRVIPVLLQGARMPRLPDLPESLHVLARRQAVELSHARWRTDLSALADAIGEGATRSIDSARAPGPTRAEREPGPSGDDVRTHVTGTRPSIPILAAGAILMVIAIVSAWILTGGLRPTSPEGGTPMSAFGVPCTVVGSDGDDEGEGITGTAGDDVICGLGGKDLIVASPGDDLIDGGLGEDRVTYAGGASGVIVDLGTGVVSGGSGNDRLASVEGVMDTPHADRLTGSPGRDAFWLYGGADVVDAGAGLDSVDYAYSTAIECLDDTLTNVEETYPAGACP